MEREMTSSELNYLMAIDRLYSGAKGIKLVSIAERMGVTKVSVFRAAKLLEHDGLIQRDDKNKVVITRYGYEQLEKYRVLIAWLGNHLERNCKVAHETAVRDAMGAVCAFSEESINALSNSISTEREKRNDR